MSIHASRRPTVADLFTKIGGGEKVDPCVFPVTLCLELTYISSFYSGNAAIVYKGASENTYTDLPMVGIDGFAPPPRYED